MTPTDSVRHLQSFTDTMARYHGDIERLVFAGEVACHEMGGDRFNCPAGRKCPFKIYILHKENDCLLNVLRDKLGDHVKQDDATEVRE
jgi:hypothetical protein